MSYQERGVEIGIETTYGVAPTSYEVFNSLLDWDTTATEVYAEENPVGGQRDAVIRQRLQREVSGRFVTPIFSAKLFRFALGRISDEATDPYTISPENSIPSFTLKRGLADPNNVNYVTGCKVDTMTLTLEQGEDVTAEIAFVGQDSSLDTGAYTPPSIDPSLLPYCFYHGKVVVDGSTLSDLQSCVIEIANNLVARFSASGGKRVIEKLEEGPLRVTGRFTVGEGLESRIQDVLAGNTFTLELELKEGTKILTLTVKNCRLTEWSDTVRGRDLYEIEFPFVSAPTSAGLDVISVVQSGETYNEGKF